MFALSLLFSFAFANDPQEPTNSKSFPAYVHTWECKYSAPVSVRTAGGGYNDIMRRQEKTYKVTELKCSSNETNFAICRKLHSFNSDILKKNKIKDGLIIQEYNSVLKEEITNDDMGTCIYRIQYIASEQMTPKQYGFKSPPDFDVYKETNIK